MFGTVQLLVLYNLLENLNITEQKKITKYQTFLMAGKAKKPDAASTKSSTKSFKSLKASATSTLKTLKRKAVGIISPKKRSKQGKNTPKEDNASDDSSNVTEGDASQPSVSRRQASSIEVIDIDQDTDDAAESSEAELGK